MKITKNRPIIRLFLTLITITFCWLCYTQDPVSIPLTEIDGLPDTEFYGGLEDNQGFIWLASNSGLYRYDGKLFQHFINPKQRGNAVFSPFLDSKKRIWCTNISTQFFYTQDDNLILFVDLFEEFNSSLTNFIVTETHLVVSSQSKIVLVDLVTKKITKRIIASNLFGILTKVNNSIVFSNGNSVVKTDTNLTTLDSISVPLFDLAKTNIGLDKGILLIPYKNSFVCAYRLFGENKFYNIDFENSKYEKLKTPSELSNCFIVDMFINNKELWFATNIGLFIYELNNNIFTFKQHFFEDRFITEIFKDKDQSIWFTTKSKGVFIVPNMDVKSYDLKGFENPKRILKISDHELLTGTIDGKVGVLNVGSSEFKLFNTKTNTQVTEITYNPYIEKTIIIKDNDALWYTNKTKSLKKLPNNKLHAVKAISALNDSSYLVSSYKNAYLLNENFEDEHIIYPKRTFTNYHSTATGNTYIASIDGLLLLHDDLTTKQLLYNGEPIYATSITETSNNIIWVSTYKNGIYGIQKDAVKINYNNNNGVLSNKINIVKGDSSFLWISTKKGLQRLNILTGEFQKLTKQDGILTCNINDIALFDNTLVVSSNKGLFSIDKTKVFKNTAKPKIYFESIVNKKDTLSFNKNHTLEYDNRAIKFNFNANGFHSKTYQYQYRLLGLDSTWVTAENAVRSVTYNSLSSGNYNFQVRALSNDKSSEIKSFVFTINKPFWLSWWFIALTILSLGLVIYIIIKVRIKTIKREQAELLQKEIINRQLILSQLENLRSQMNPHFIFNALNSIQEYIVSNEKDLASSYLVKFSRLIRMYLEHSRLTYVSLDEELKALELYLQLEKDRFEDTLTYTIELSKQIDTSTTYVPSLFIQPYFENAIKHGLLHKKDNRKLSVTFQLNSEEQILICEIIDNGIGIKASMEINENKQNQHNSFATKANLKRVELLNTSLDKKITVNTIDLGKTRESGTKVILTIPLHIDI